MLYPGKGLKMFYFRKDILQLYVYMMYLYIANTYYIIIVYVFSTSNLVVVFSLYIVALGLTATNYQLMI